MCRYGASDIGTKQPSEKTREAVEAVESEESEK